MSARLQAGNEGVFGTEGFPEGKRLLRDRKRGLGHRQVEVRDAPRGARLRSTRRRRCLHAVLRAKDIGMMVVRIDRHDLHQQAEHNQQYGLEPGFHLPSSCFFYADKDKEKSRPRNNLRAQLGCKVQEVFNMKQSMRLFRHTNHAEYPRTTSNRKSEAPWTAVWKSYNCVGNESVHNPLIGSEEIWMEVVDIWRFSFPPVVRS